MSELGECCLLSSSQLKPQTILVFIIITHKTPKTNQYVYFCTHTYSNSSWDALRIGISKYEISDAHAHSKQIKKNNKKLLLLQ